MDIRSHTCTVTVNMLYIVRMKVLFRLFTFDVLSVENLVITGYHKSITESLFSIRDREKQQQKNKQYENIFTTHLYHHV